jgi:hypothetical protein
MADSQGFTLTHSVRRDIVPPSECVTVLRVRLEVLWVLSTLESALFPLFRDSCGLTKFYSSLFTIVTSYSMQLTQLYTLSALQVRFLWWRFSVLRLNGKTFCQLLAKHCFPICPQYWRTFVVVSALDWKRLPVSLVHSFFHHSSSIFAIFLSIAQDSEHILAIGLSLQPIRDEKDSSPV